MLTKGINHVAFITSDLDRLIAFYTEVFDAELVRDGSEFPDGKGPRLAVLKLSEWSEVNVFEIEGTHARGSCSAYSPFGSRARGSLGP